MPRKILVVDDAESLRRAMAKSLAQSGFSVMTAGNGSDALLMAQEAGPDLVLADADLPGLDGHALCRVLRRGGATRHIPIIIISGAMIDEKDVVSGLDGGADDYLLKPFPMKVLLARIQAVLRRYRDRTETRERLKRCGIELDPGAREVRVRGRAVKLARREFDLLALLIERAGRVVTTGHLLEWVWGYDPAEYNDPHTVQTHVSRLRRKLGPKVSGHIVNVRSYGYKFEG